MELPSCTTTGINDLRYTVFVMDESDSMDDIGIVNMRQTMSAIISGTLALIVYITLLCKYVIFSIPFIWLQRLIKS